MKVWFPFLIMALLSSGCQTSTALVTSELPTALSAAQTGVLVFAHPDALTCRDERFVKNPVPAELIELWSADGVDPETLADNALLTSADQLPPDNEGETRPVQSVYSDFPVVENAKVQFFIDYYSSGNGKHTFRRWLERSARYIPLMQEIFAAEGLPRDLAYLAMVESGFNTRAYSWAHAVGPWQFIGGTGRMYDLKSDWWRDERRDFEKSTRAAAAYLHDLSRRFDGEWYLAVASYNAGPGKISRAINKYNSRDFWEISRGKYLQTETKNYLPKLLAALLIAADPEKYGFVDLDWQEPLAYETVTVPTATDLEVVARLSGVDYEELKQLNPELKRWCTPPGETDYTLRVPPGTGKTFLTAYAELPMADRANYKHHRVVAGDTLLMLAKKYRIQVDDIVALNKISNPRALRIGTDLVLPLKKGYTHLPIAEMKDDYNRSRRQLYTVRSGDSLWSIAQRFNVTAKELRVWNRLGWSNVIRPGQRLMVSAKAARTEKPERRAQRPGGAPRKIVYQVRPGDTVWEISRRFAVDTKQICSWNNLEAGQIIRPGDRLTLLVRDGKQG